MDYLRNDMKDVNWKHKTRCQRQPSLVFCNILRIIGNNAAVKSCSLYKIAHMHTYMCVCSLCVCGFSMCVCVCALPTCVCVCALCVCVYSLCVCVFPLCVCSLCVCVFSIWLCELDSMFMNVCIWVCVCVRTFVCVNWTACSYVCV